MKKDAERRGAELAPISLTAGTSSGSGVVSMRTCCWNLQTCQLFAHQRDISASVASANGAARGRIVKKRLTGVFGSSFCRVFLALCPVDGLSLLDNVSKWSNGLCGRRNWMEVRIGAL
jgi:hypothetical protein